MGKLITGAERGWCCYEEKRIICRSQRAARWNKCGSPSPVFRACGQRHARDRGYTHLFR